jgi:hypothetical protein|eukprot:4359666-Prymnesium_polylepis.3
MSPRCRHDFVTSRCAARASLPHPPQVRVYEKASTDYEGDVGRVMDVLRSRMEASSGDGMHALLRRIKEGIKHTLRDGRRAKLTLLRGKNKCAPKKLVRIVGTT